MPPSSSQDWHKYPLNMAIQRIFGVTKPRLSDSARAASRLPIEQIRESLRTLLHDCKGMRTQQIIYRINVAQTPADLWLLRSDLHQCIAQVHNQTEAIERINSLVDVFGGWLPAGQLTRI